MFVETNSEHDHERDVDAWSNVEGIGVETGKHSFRIQCPSVNCAEKSIIDAADNCYVGSVEIGNDLDDWLPLPVDKYLQRAASHTRKEALLSDEISVVRAEVFEEHVAEQRSDVRVHGKELISVRVEQTFLSLERKRRCFHFVLDFSCGMVLYLEHFWGTDVLCHYTTSPLRLDIAPIRQWLLAGTVLRFIASGRHIDG